MRPKVLTVVAALIEREGEVLICQRKKGSSHELKWEFPGGKVESGETPPQALERELEGELGIRARIGPEMERYEFRYPQRQPIELIFYRVLNFTGEVRNRVFEEIRWERRIKLPSYDFLDGDIDFVRRLVRLR